MPVKITDDTPSRSITVAGVILKCHSPYEEGHVLDEKEASTLNQTWAENLRNNFASHITEEGEKVGGVTNLDLRKLQDEFTQYEAGYEFGARGGREAMDPVLAEAVSSAEKAVRDAIKRKGYKITNFTREKIRSMALDAIEKNPIFLENARKVVAQRQATADVQLEDLEA